MFKNIFDPKKKLCITNIIRNFARKEMNKEVLIKNFQNVLKVQADLKSTTEQKFSSRKQSEKIDNRLNLSDSHEMVRRFLTSNEDVLSNMEENLKAYLLSMKQNLTRAGLMQDEKFIQSLVEIAANFTNKATADTKSASGFFQTTVFRFLVLVDQIISPRSLKFYENLNITHVAFPHLREIFGLDFFRLFEDPKGDNLLNYNFLYFLLINKGEISNSLDIITNAIKDSHIFHTLDSLFDTSISISIPEKLELPTEFSRFTFNTVSTEYLKSPTFKYNDLITKQRLMNEYLEDKKTYERLKLVSEALRKCKERNEFSRRDFLSIVENYLSINFLKDTKTIFNEEYNAIKKELNNMNKFVSFLVKDATKLQKPKISITFENLYEVYNPLFSGEFNLHAQFKRVMDSFAEEEELSVAFLIAKSLLQTYLNKLNSPNVHVFKYRDLFNFNVMPLEDYSCTLGQFVYNSKLIPEHENIIDQIEIQLRYMKVPTLKRETIAKSEGQIRRPEQASKKEQPIKQQAKKSQTFIVPPKLQELNKTEVKEQPAKKTSTKSVEQTKMAPQVKKEQNKKQETKTKKLDEATKSSKGEEVAMPVLQESQTTKVDTSKKLPNKEVQEIIPKEEEVEVKVSPGFNSQVEKSVTKDIEHVASSPNHEGKSQENQTKSNDSVVSAPEPKLEAHTEVPIPTEGKVNGNTQKPEVQENVTKPNEEVAINNQPEVKLQENVTQPNEQHLSNNLNLNEQNEIPIQSKIENVPSTPAPEEINIQSPTQNEMNENDRQAIENLKKNSRGKVRHANFEPINNTNFYKNPRRGYASNENDSHRAPGKFIVPPKENKDQTQEASTRKQDDTTGETKATSGLTREEAKQTKFIKPTVEPNKTHQKKEKQATPKFIVDKTNYEMIDDSDLAIKKEPNLSSVKQIPEVFSSLKTEEVKTDIRLPPEEPTEKIFKDLENLSQKLQHNAKEDFYFTYADKNPDKIDIERASLKYGTEYWLNRLSFENYEDTQPKQIEEKYLNILLHVFRKYSNFKAKSMMVIYSLTNPELKEHLLLDPEYCFYLLFSMDHSSELFNFNLGHLGYQVLLSNNLMDSSLRNRSRLEKIISHQEKYKYTVNNDNVKTLIEICDTYHYPKFLKQRIDFYVIKQGLHISPENFTRHVQVMSNFKETASYALNLIESSYVDFQIPIKAEFYEYVILRDLKLREFHKIEGYIATIGQRYKTEYFNAEERRKENIRGNLILIKTFIEYLEYNFKNETEDTYEFASACKFIDGLVTDTKNLNTNWAEDVEFIGMLTHYLYAFSKEYSEYAKIIQTVMHSKIHSSIITSKTLVNLFSIIVKSNHERLFFIKKDLFEVFKLFFEMKLNMVKTLKFEEKFFILRHENIFKVLKYFESLGKENSVPFLKLLFNIILDETTYQRLYEKDKNSLQKVFNQVYTRKEANELLMTLDIKRKTQRTFPPLGFEDQMI